MTVSWDETSDGLRFLRCCYGGEDERAMIATIDEVAALVGREPRPVPVLIDGRGFRPSARYLGHAKGLNRSVFGPRRTVATMTVTDTLTRTLINGFNNVGGGTRIRAVRTEDEAFAWFRTHLPADLGPSV